MRVSNDNGAFMAATDEQGQGAGGANAEASPEQEVMALVERINALRQESRAPEALELCEEVLRRFEGHADPAVGVQVGRALISKSGCLAQLERYAEALPSCEEVLRRYDGAAEPKPRLLAAKALSHKGFLLEVTGRSDEALRIYEEVLRRYEGTDDAELLPLVASTLASKACFLEDPAQQLAAQEEVIRRFSDSRESDVRRFALLATLQKVTLLRRQGRREEEVLATCDQAVQRFGDESDPQMIGCLGLILSTKAMILTHLNRLEDSLATHDEAIRILGRASVPDVMDQWALAVFNKAFALKQLGRAEEALPCYDLLVERLGGAHAEALRVRAAEALIEKAEVLDQLKRTPDALAAYDDVVQRWGGDAGTEVLARVAEALLDKGLVQARLGQLGEAMSAFSTAFRRFEGSTQEALRERAVKALLCTSILLFAMNQTDDALAVVGKAKRKFSGETGLTLLHAVHALVDETHLMEGLGLVREYVSVFDAVLSGIPEPTEALRPDFVLAHRRVSLVLLAQARKRAKDKREQAMKLLEQSLDKALALLKLEPDNPLHLGHAGYLSFLTGRREQSLELVRGALRLGSRDQPRWLLSAGEHAFPEDDAFVALVRSL